LVPTEIVLQEVRGAEGSTLLLALNSGHDGLMTWHANEGEEIDALADMAKMHAAALSVDIHDLREKCRNAFHIIA
jgi:Flp pilus assembly CpaF family ATPase